MPDFPPIPNAVLWFVLAFTTIVALITAIPAINWIWRRWLADRWASRSKEAAMKRAQKLLWRTADCIERSNDRVAALAVAQRGLYRLINGLVLVVFVSPLAGVAATLILVTERLPWLAYFLFAVTALGYSLGILFLVASWRDEDYGIAPLIDLPGFKDKQARKIRRLLMKSGYSESEADDWFTRELAAELNTQDKGNLPSN